MNHRYRATTLLLAGAIGVLAATYGVSHTSTNAQPPDGGTWTQSRTPWGDPDLQGVWRYESAIPLERPARFEGREQLTDAEVAQIQKVEQEQAAQRLAGAEGAAVGRRSVSESPIRGNEYNSFWQDHGRPRQASKRTSLVVDPPDGRVPALTAEGQQRATARAARGYDSWADRSLWERCITRGLPMVPGPYNNNYQILQTPDHVVILHEMIHDARIIPLDGRPHVGSGIRQWFGDSRGRWEGNTLVVSTMNFTDKANFRGSTDGLHLIERFTRVDANSVKYEFTIDDPTTFTKKWTVAIPMTGTDEQIYEYACHEGNYGMVNLLNGARIQEKTGP
jgi:hypothetical protein